MKPILALILSLLISSSVSGNADTDAKINQLIIRLEVSGCSFTRNGSTYNSLKAADHLRLKYRNGKKWVNSAEQFIDRLATKSSWSGKPYTVNCGKGETPSGPWLHAQLVALRTP